jgi:hypothetical protein
MTTDGIEAGKSKRKLTVKQTRFAASYADPHGANGNGTLAAKIAGYRGDGNQLAVQAAANLRNPRVRQSIEEVLEANGCTLDRAALAVAEAMQATKRRSFLAKNGKIVYAAAEPDHKIRLSAADVTFRLRGSSGRQTNDTKVILPGQPSADQANPIVPVAEAAERELAALPQTERVVVCSVLDKVLRMISLSEQGTEQSASPVEPPASDGDKAGDH